MTKEEVRRILNVGNQSFYYVVRVLSTYFLTEPVRSATLNYIVLSAKGKKKFTTLDLISYFYNFGKDVISKTAFCNSVYAEKMLMKTVWEQTHMLNLVVTQIKNNFKLLNIPEKRVEDTKVLTREEQLKKQAERMREAKAKKRAERLAKEAALQAKKAPKEIQKKQESDASVVKTSKSKFSKEQLEHIELLKRMRT